MNRQVSVPCSLYPALNTFFSCAKKLREWPRKGQHATSNLTGNLEVSLQLSSRNTSKKIDNYKTKQAVQLANLTVKKKYCYAGSMTGFRLQLWQCLIFLFHQSWHMTSSPLLEQCTNISTKNELTQLRIHVFNCTSTSNGFVFHA